MAGSQILVGPTLVQAGRSGGGFPKCMKPGPDGALSLRDQARAIACSASDPANAWKKLCEWASAQPDPKAAMHPALFQMVDKHGADARFAYVAAEVTNAAAAARASMPEKAAENLATMLGNCVASTGHMQPAASSFQPSFTTAAVSHETHPQASPQPQWDTSHFMIVREMSFRANDYADSGITHLPPASTTDNKVSGLIYDVVEMHPDNMNPAHLRKEAHSIAAKSEEPFTAWTELRRWSLGKGPAATKVAVIEFMEQHGRRPESAAIIPEIARLAMVMPEPERKEMLDMAHRSFSLSTGFERSAPAPRTMNPALPKNKAPAKTMQAPPVHPDIARMIEQRDIIFHVNRGGLGLPKAGKKADIAAKLPLTRETFAPVLSAGRGHVLINSLADRLSAHGHEAYSQPEAAAAPKMAKRRPVRRSAGKRKPLRAAMKKSAKSSARKKARPARRIVRELMKKGRRKTSRRK
jgi:hypothetical protein